MSHRSVIVTGAAGGIGRAAALRFAAEPGSRLLLADRDSDGLAAIAAEATGLGAAVATRAGDLSDPAEPAAIVAAALEAHGAIDVVVSNAGTSRRGPLEAQTVENWDYILAVNARATWLLAQAAFEPLRASRGTIVAVASIAGIEPNPGTGFYSASKAALISLVAQLALEWSDHGIRVNAVSPGVTLTGINAHQYDDKDLKARREALVPLNRFAAPDEIAGAIAYLASDAARFCQGFNLVVDGGLTPAVLAHALPPIARR